METLSQRFQIYPLWRTFSNLSVSVCENAVYVWTEPVTV